MSRDFHIKLSLFQIECVNAYTQGKCADSGMIAAKILLY